MVRKSNKAELEMNMKETRQEDESEGEYNLKKHVVSIFRNKFFRLKSILRATTYLKILQTILKTRI